MTRKSNKGMGSEEAIRRFIVDGFLVLPPAADLPHRRICTKLLTALRDHGDPGNNCVAAVCAAQPPSLCDRSQSDRSRTAQVPELADVTESAELVGACSSLLGANYVLHAHRRVHLAMPGRQTTMWHQDS